MVEIHKGEVKPVTKFEGGSAGNNTLDFDIGIKNFDSKQKINSNDT